MNRYFFLLLFSFILGMLAIEVQAQQGNTAEKFSIQMLLSPKIYSEELDQSFEVVVTEEYVTIDSNAILIENGYASSIIKNPNDWKGDLLADTVKVIFSMYPKYQEFWMTNYHVLLTQRLKALFRIAPELNSNTVHWQLVLQTDCENEPEAIGLFHGFEINGTKQISIKTEPVEKPDQFIEAITLDSNQLIDQYQFVSNFIEENGGFGDSTVYNVLDRNRQWEDALVVLDWTGSMYHHGAMSVLWHITHLENTNIKYFTFFNDGNSKKKRNKKIGKTGGIYFATADDLEKVAKSFLKIQRRGDGGDSPENDVEALKRAAKKFPLFKSIILVADNQSCMRDFTLFYKLKFPVHIILPGNYNVINHQYVNLAYKTKGSIHTFDEDILDFAVEKAPKSLTIQNEIYFRNQYNLYQTENPISYHICNQFYGVKKYTKRIKDAYKKN